MFSWSCQWIAVCIYGHVMTCMFTGAPVWFGPYFTSPLSVNFSSFHASILAFRNFSSIESTKFSSIYHQVFKCKLEPRLRSSCGSTWVQKDIHSQVKSFILSMFTKIQLSRYWDHIGRALPIYWRSVVGGRWPQSRTALRQIWCPRTMSPCCRRRWRWDQGYSCWQNTFFE